MNSIFVEAFVESEVEKIVNSLKNNKAPGIDGVGSFTIKIVLKSILKVLTYLINLSLSTGRFPESLKMAVIIPIFKKGDPQSVNQYRPISLISSFSKIYEKCMKDRLLKYYKAIHFFSSNQYGFLSGSNTESALLGFVGEVYNGINENKCVSGLYLDITKAFYCVDHDILLDILNHSGIRGITLNWFKSYLKNRKQCVRVEGNLSRGIEIKYGVPQGSVLGAILFIVYINSVCAGRLEGQVYAFADDTAICYVRDNWADVSKAMQSDLDALRWWFARHYMILSVEKTTYINFSLRRKVSFLGGIRYKCLKCVVQNNMRDLCSVIIQSDFYKYLGVVIDSELSWKNHVVMMKSKLLSSLRVFYFLNNICPPNLMRKFYFSVIHSRLEYGVSCWGGTYITNLNSVLKLQKRFVRLIAKQGYREPSLPLFRSMLILPLRYVYLFKVLRIFFNRSRNSNNQRQEVPYCLRDTGNFVVPRAKKNILMKFYTNIAPRVFNQLPIKIKNCRNENSFCRLLKIWMFTIDDIEVLLNIVM